MGRSKSIFLALLIFSIILILGKSWFCDKLYLNHIHEYEAEFGKNVPNPYNLSWNILWEKLVSAERFLLICFIVLWIKPFRMKEWKLYFYSEKDVVTRMAIIYWQCSFGDFADRLFFNVYEFGPNDIFVYAWVVYYTIKTIMYARTTI